MTKQFILCIVLLLGIGLCSEAQPVRSKKTVKSAKTVKKKRQVPAVTAPQEEVANDAILDVGDGKMLYMGNPGDQLVYEVNAGGQTYDFIMTLGKKTDDIRYSFDWQMTGAVNKRGHTDISAKAAYDSKKYKNYFSGGNLSLTDACTVWMTGSNFADMPEKKTTMQLDDNEPETFYRKDEAETEYDILYKGKPVKLDIFKIDNDKEGAAHRQLWVQGISSMPLIVKMDLGWRIHLKAIR